MALYFALVYAPTEQTMGMLQRVFLLPPAASHPLVFAAFLVGFGSLMYLVTRDLKWDRFAYCNAELGVLFTATTLITGMIWGRLAWNVWWAGDARTNLELILGLLYVGYLMLRAYLPGTREKSAAFDGLWFPRRVGCSDQLRGDLLVGDAASEAGAGTPRRRSRSRDQVGHLCFSGRVHDCLCLASDEKTRHRPTGRRSRSHGIHPGGFMNPAHARTYRCHRRLHRGAGRAGDFHRDDVEEENEPGTKTKPAAGAIRAVAVGAVIEPRLQRKQILALLVPGNFHQSDRHCRCEHAADQIHQKVLLQQKDRDTKDDIVHEQHG